MNRNLLTRIAAIAAIVAVISLLIAGIIGVVTGAFKTTTLHFSNVGHAGSVAIDERKSLSITSIKRITINAVSENITIRDVSGNDIMVRFHGNVSSSSPAGRPHLQVNQQGDMAEIRIERQNRVFGWTNSDAVLEVGIPKQYAGSLTAEAVSSGITVGSHKYTELALTTTSGDTEANAVRAGHLSLHTISGSIRAQDLSTERTEINTVSGDIDVKAITGDVDVHSTSGDVALTFTKMPSSIAIETVSGDVCCGMPSNTGFTLGADSVSGNVTCGFPITLTNSRTGGGEHSIVGTVGSGKCAVTARTISGDIGITRNTDI